MKVYQINIFGNLSTGKIAVDIYKVLKENGHDGKIAFARNNIEKGVPHYRIGTDLDVKIHALMTRITDKTGFYSKKATKGLIEDIKNYNPDVIHLHNIHGYYVNIEMLFNFLKEYGKPVVWTLHDCWAFTGHCAYYSAGNCSKWKTECHNCALKKEYPTSLFMDSSKWNFKKKKELFTSVLNLTLVPVSKWLENEVKQSFLKNCNIKTITNGIDMEVFKPTKSNVREKYGLRDKFVILGVASTWSKRKGFDDFIKLSKRLTDNQVMFMVGLDDKQIQSLPKNIIGIKRTDSVKELVEIYTMADVFFNASVEETFGLPTVEALACGTPVIVYDATALPEVVERNYGFIVEQNNIDKVYEAINKTNRLDVYYFKSHNHDKVQKFKKYIELYENI